MHTHPHTTQPPTQPPAEGRVSTKRGVMGQEECEMCGKRVYLMERLAVENHVFHRACFKCHSCSTRLKPGSYEFDRDTDRFYCGTHYRDLLRQKTVKRTMEQRNLTSPSGEEGEGEGEAVIQAPKRKKEVASTHTPSSDAPEPVKGAAVPRFIAKSATKDAKTGSQAAEATLTNDTLATPTDISCQESAKIRSGLPSLLKSLASAKQDNAISSRDSSSGEKLADQSGAGQHANIRDDLESSRTVLNPGTEKLPRQVDAKLVTTTTKATPTATPPVTFVSLANGKVGGSSALPEQLSSGKQLPGKLLSGKQVASDKVVIESSKEQETRARDERTTEKERGEGERKQRQPDAGPKKTAVNNEETVPVKPPRRRTRKALTTGPGPLNESVTSQDKVHVARGPVTVFNCYLFLLFALVAHCVLYALYRLYVAVSDVSNF